jgi:hypothetical protein
MNCLCVKGGGGGGMTEVVVPADVVPVSTELPRLLASLPPQESQAATNDAAARSAAGNMSVRESRRTVLRLFGHATSVSHGRSSPRRLRSSASARAAFCLRSPANSASAASTACASSRSTWASRQKRPCHLTAARPKRCGDLSASSKQSSSASVSPTCSSSEADERASVTLPRSSARRKRWYAEPCEVTNACSHGNPQKATGAATSRRNPVYRLRTTLVRAAASAASQRLGEKRPLQRF